MPFANHLRLTVRGTFGPAGAPFEEFSYGLNLSDNAVRSQAFDQSMLDDLVADVTAFHSAPTSYMVAAARVREVKVAQIGALGTYRSDPLIASVNIPGGQALAQLPHPPQVALAVSLGTERRGATGRGRFYLPCPALSVDDTGLFPEVDAAKIRGAVSIFLQAVNNWPGVDTADPQIVVASSKGYNSTVTGFRLGRALDTIRSRRRSLDEMYGLPVAVT
jgi:hypothetical protein